MTKLNLAMNDDFKEAKLGSDFCKDEIAQVKRLIESSISFSVVGMPGLGISIFLRYLATRRFAYFLHLDVYELSSLTQVELLKLLPDKNQLQLLTQQHERVVIIFNRFDQLKKEFDKSFFNNLRSLRDVDKERVVMIFAANKPLYEIAPEAIDAGNLNMYSQTFYLKPYSNEELIRLLKINTPQFILNKSVLDKALKLCGGHYQLLQLLLKSERLGTPFFDPFVKAQLRQIYELLDYKQRSQVQKIALGKKIGDLNNYLLGIGLIREDKSGLKLFTPLFAEFIRTNLPLRLPNKEEKLFKLLKKNLGKVVGKEEIYNIVWFEDPLEASEWALNALVYRLRKNPAFAASGYILENHKKVGYSLIGI